MAHHLLQTPTFAITRMLQRDIVVWLSEVGDSEARASTWFNDTWTGERGNYANASADYVSNNLSSGIESNWRYMRRDVGGCAGTTQRFSLEVLRRPRSSIFQSEARNTRIRSYARKLVLVSFHLKLHTSHPSSGKRFRILSSSSPPVVL
jgi:hypothetical protein